MRFQLASKGSWETVGQENRKSQTDRQHWPQRTRMGVLTNMSRDTPVLSCDTPVLSRVPWHSCPVSCDTPVLSLALKDQFICFVTIWHDSWSFKKKIHFLFLSLLTTSSLGKYIYPTVCFSTHFISQRPLGCPQIWGTGAQCQSTTWKHAKAAPLCMLIF